MGVEGLATLLSPSVDCGDATRDEPRSCISTLTFSDSVVINAPATVLYDMVADVTRMGEWSPICVACWWDEGDGPSVGSWFSGQNVTPERTWQTRSLVVTAERGREFAFVVNDAYVQWRYHFDEGDGATHLTESWEFLEAGLAYFRERFGDEADERIAARTRDAREGIPLTLARIKATVENAAH